MRPTPTPSVHPRPHLREQALLHGPDVLSDAELLALLVGTGGAGESATRVATSVLEIVGGVGGLRQLGGHGLAARRGIGPAKAARIVAALELGRRASSHALWQHRTTMDSFDDVVDWAHPRLAPLDHEEVWLLALDGRNGLRSAQRVAQGGMHACAVVPRDVLRPAVRDGASGIILVHNHPSGDPSPSAEDARMTAALASACDVVGIDLLDHVVVARQGAASVRDRTTRIRPPH